MSSPSVADDAAVPSAQRLGRTRGKAYLSPLRYPGSKRQLVPLIASVIAALGDPVEVFGEPFGGGASVSLQLAGEGAVGSALIADKDPLVYAFWRVACYDTQWLVDAMLEEEVTLKRWERFKSSRPRDLKGRALKCLFLNRTSFSGILHKKAGPLGGKAQESKYKIDCRFPKQTLAKRLRQVGELAEQGRIFDVWRYDYRGTVEKVRLARRSNRFRTLLYFDPPFYGKGQDLYRYAFSEQDHKYLASFLRRMQLPWILSYDAHPGVRALYNGHEHRTSLTIVGKDYRAAARHYRTARELIITNVDSWEPPTEEEDNDGRTV